MNLRQTGIKCLRSGRATPLPLRRRECQEALSIALTPAFGGEGGLWKTHNWVRKAAEHGCGAWMAGGRRRLQTVHGPLQGQVEGKRGGCFGVGGDLER